MGAQPKPYCSFTIEFSPVAVLWYGEFLQGMGDKEGVDQERFWRKLYLTSVGNILTWIPNIPARFTLDKMSWMAHHPAYVEDLPTERLPQKKLAAPTELRGHSRRHRVSSRFLRTGP